MQAIKEQLHKLFTDLNDRIEAINLERREEGALVSKTVKAPEKNAILIRQAIASGAFPSLIERILKHGGKLEHFT